MIKNKKKIIIIDSGIGGLSIINKYILKKNNYIYIMDNYGFPYGNKNYIYIYKRIEKIIKFIKKKYKIYFIIIACNTASIITLKFINKKFKFKIINILPYIKKKIKKKKKKIIILGTYITINSNYIKNKIDKNLNKKNIKKIYSSDLINETEKKIKYKKKNNKEIYKIISKILKKYNYPNIIILACTHFYFLKNYFRKILKKKTYIIDHLNKLKKNIKKYIKNNKNYYNINNNYFLYTKKEKFNKLFIKKIKKKYLFNKIKKIKI